MCTGKSKSLNGVSDAHIEERLRAYLSTEEESDESVLRAVRGDTRASDVAAPGGASATDEKFEATPRPLRALLNFQVQSLPDWLFISNKKV